MQDQTSEHLWVLDQIPLKTHEEILLIRLECITMEPQKSAKCITIT